MKKLIPLAVACVLFAGCSMRSIKLGNGSYRSLSLGSDFGLDEASLNPTNGVFTIKGVKNSQAQAFDSFGKMMFEAGKQAGKAAVIP